MNEKIFASKLELSKLQTGYRQEEILEAKAAMEEAIESIKQNTRRFAKRQITWFKRSENMRWYDPRELETIIQDLDDVVLAFHNEGQKN